MEKIYEVEFMSYTNCMKDTVRDEEKELGKGQYLTVGREPFLIKESEFSKYQKYGDGFRIIRFVGNMKESIEELGEWVKLPVDGSLFRCGNINCARKISDKFPVNTISYCPYCGEKKKKYKEDIV